MRTALVVLVCIGIASSAAHAGPATHVIDEKDVAPALRALAGRLEEPTGMTASADIPKLGLLKGDLVRSINGLPANGNKLMWEVLSATTLYLDVLRGKKQALVVVSIKLGPQQLTFEREKVKELIARLRDRDTAFRQVTAKGAASGVMSTAEFGYLAFMQDTIIRSVNGKPTATAADLVASLEAAVDQPSIRLGLERNNQAFTFTMVLEETPTPEPLDFTKIKKLNDTTYEIPADLRDAVLANPMAIAKGARIVPAMKDGKTTGFKVYAIRPNSLYAALGLANGDTLVSVDGTVLDGGDKGMEVYTRIRTAKEMKVEILRRGNALTITYKLQ
jgi:hypothetical protein